jgi:heterodisulfide reductase subunit B
MPQGIKAATEELVEEMKELDKVSEISAVENGSVHFRLASTLSARRLSRLAPSGFGVNVTVTTDDFTSAYVYQE